MTLHPVQKGSGPDRSDMAPDPATSVPELAPISVLDLLNRTISNKERATNAAMIVKTATKGVCKVILSLGVVLIAILVLTGTLIHFAGFGPALGSAIAVGATVVAGGQYLWNRRASRGRVGNG